MPSSKKNDGLLARVNFPLYTIQMLTNRHVLVGGGGGSAKTGVANGFEIFELTTFNGQCSAKEVVRHETGLKVVMNSACFSNKKNTYLAVGQDSHCQLYRVGITVETEPVDVQENDVSENQNLRHRKQNKDQRNGITDSANTKKQNKKLCFEFHAGDSVQTDFSEKEPCQRVLTISRCGNWMATGGTDGVIRLWSFPAMKLSKVLKGHTEELDDLHFSPNSKQIVSVAKDGKALVWDLRTGKQLHSLSWTHPGGIKYLFKRSKFGLTETKGCRLFTTSNPVAGGKEAHGWLHSWDGDKVFKAISLPEPTSALAVRDDGMFLVIGTMFTGSVSIYISFSLQRVLHVEGAHSMFVTGVELIPSESPWLIPSHGSWSASEVAALSISVDNRVCIHSLPYRRTLPPWLVIIIIVVTLFFTFLLCSYFGL